MPSSLCCSATSLSSVSASILKSCSFVISLPPRSLRLDTRLQFGHAFGILRHIDLLHQALDLVQLMQFGLVRLKAERLVLETAC